MFFQFRIVTISDVKEYWTTSIMDSPEYLSFNFYWDELFTGGVLPLTVIAFLNTRIYLKVKIVHWQWFLITVKYYFRVRETLYLMVTAHSRFERRQNWLLIVLLVQQLLIIRVLSSQYLSSVQKHLIIHPKDLVTHQKTTFKTAV